MSNWMKTVRVTPNAIKYAEETKGFGQTTNGRISELISNGAKYEHETDAENKQ